MRVIIGGITSFRSRLAMSAWSVIMDGRGMPASAHYITQIYKFRYNKCYGATNHKYITAYTFLYAPKYVQRSGSNVQCKYKKNNTAKDNLQNKVKVLFLITVIFSLTDLPINILDRFVEI